MKEGETVNSWLESVYTIFDRIGDFLETAYNAITNGVSYISGSVSSVLGAGLPSEITGVLVLCVAVCIILLILGR